MKVIYVKLIELGVKLILRGLDYLGDKDGVFDPDDVVEIVKHIEEIIKRKKNKK